MGRSALIFLAAAAACGRGHDKPAASDAGPAARAATTIAAIGGAAATPGVVASPKTCAVADKQDVDAALDEAAHRFEVQDFAGALACAEQAARVAPRSVEAHHDRADALAALERWDEAKQAYAMALALDPDDPQTLAGAADLYVNRMGQSRDLTAIGLEYARRGSAHVGRRRNDRELQARLAMLEAEALDDLERADEALPRAEAAINLDAASLEARYERALILFHLCRLEPARRAFEELLAKEPNDAYAHHHLGLILERVGRSTEAEDHLARARRLSPEQFKTPIIVSASEFRGLVDDEIKALDPTTRRLLDGVSVETQDVPEMADLTAAEPPFPPTILGLFRGPPLGQPLSEPRAIVLYRKNLGRAVSSYEELVKQVRVTLLHEIGHLVGADEEELRARGFE